MMVVVTAVVLLLRHTALATQDPAADAAADAAAPLEKTTVLLYFADGGGRFLKPERIMLPAATGPAETAHAIVAAAINGPGDPSLRPTLPPGAAVRAVYLAPDRTAVVDLDSTVRDRHPGGVTAEALSVFSIVNSLVLNLAQIERVVLLLDGKAAKTFAGHIDIESPLKANILIIR